MPDFERWANNYVLITFDNDPTEDHERLSSLDAASRRSLIGRTYSSARVPGLSSCCVWTLAQGMGFLGNATIPDIQGFVVPNHWRRC